MLRLAFEDAGGTHAAFAALAVEQRVAAVLDQAVEDGLAGRHGELLAALRQHEVDGLVARPDGNNVSMDRESLQLAEAQLKFKTGVALLHLEYQKINDAIHADGK